jgi:salicylate hydroxylase/6-hydroxynicotinate 3-monooxygenase
MSDLNLAGESYAHSLAAADRSIARAFRRFEATRKPRTSRVQLNSRTNTWLKTRIDPEWVYGYDAWREPLATLN